MITFSFNNFVQISIDRILTHILEGLDGALKTLVNFVNFSYSRTVKF
jgi:hypothetical protein